jgi:hypothetical protein
MVGFEDVEIAEEHRGLRVIPAGESGVAGGQPFPLSPGFLDAGITGGDVDADDVDRPVGCGQSDRSGPRRKVADLVTEVVGARPDPADQPAVRNSAAAL